MKVISVCGKRGLGDLVQGMSWVFCNIKEDTHIVNYYPPGFNYETTVPAVIEAFRPPPNCKITYEVRHDWCTVNYKKAVEKFGLENYQKTWFFNAMGRNHRYYPFKILGHSNPRGPIALTLNHAWGIPGHPVFEKYFEPELNQKLLNLVDNVNFISLGLPRSYEENIKLLAGCRYVIGVEGAWTHITHAMKIKCITIRNNMSMKLLSAVHRRHPNHIIAETSELSYYLGMPI